MTIRTKEIPDKWMLVIKLAIGSVTFGLPMIVALNVWLVTETFSQSTQLAVMESRFKTFADEGPRYTRDQAELDQLKANRAVVAEIKRDLTDPLQTAIHALRVEIKAVHSAP